MRRAALVVEDDAELRGMLQLALGLEGYDVVTAADGLEALQRIDRHPPDLVVLDLGLPKVTGVEIIRELSAHAHTRGISIIVVTGSGEDVYHPNVVCVLRKPIDPKQLVEAVRKCLGG